MRPGFPPACAGRPGSASSPPDELPVTRGAQAGEGEARRERPHDRCRRAGRELHADCRRRRGAGGIEPRFLNRELSLLDYNARVLACAEDESRPALARAQFVAILASNLDEFFQIRVSGLREQLSAGVRGTSPDGMSPREQLDAIRSRAQDLVARQTHVFEKRVRPQLHSSGIGIADWGDLKKAEREELHELFEQRVFPVLTPLSVDPAHPFPYISDLSLNLAVVVRDPKTGLRRFARVKVPPLLPRFLKLPGGRRFVPLEQVIAAHLGRLFPGMKIVECRPFRVTRDADLEVEVDEADDLLATLESLLRSRRPAPEAVRLEVAATCRSGCGRCCSASCG